MNLVRRASRPNRCSDSSFTVELWRPVVFNVAIMDRYLPGILAVISGAKNAIQAIALVESN